MRAVVLSGGGAKGAYEVGALKYLLESGMRYDIFTGVSVGALNASYLAQFKSEDVMTGFVTLENIWKNISNEKVYKSWFLFGQLAALWKMSLFNSEPLENLVSSMLNTDVLKSSGKKLLVGATCLKTGEYKLFDQNHPDIIKAVIASSVFPGFFCPVKIEGNYWLDGGVRETTPIMAAIQAGATHIDIISTVGKLIDNRFPDNPKTLDVAGRSLGLMADEIANADIKKAVLYNRLIDAGVETGKKRISIRLVQPMINIAEDALDFQKDECVNRMLLGYEDAKRIEILI